MFYLNGMKKIINFFPYKSDYETVKDFLNRIEDDIIVFYNVGFAALIKENEFLNKVKYFTIDKSSGIIKLSINTVPVDIYISDKKYILDHLDSMKNRFEAGGNIF